MEIKDKKYLKEILDKIIKKGLIQMTLPDKPTSPKHKYISFYDNISFIKFKEE